MRLSHLFVHEFGSARYSVGYICTFTGEDVAILMFSAADVHEGLSYEGFFAWCCHQPLCGVSLPIPHEECPFGHSVIVPASSLTGRDRLTISWGVSHTRFLWYGCGRFHDTSLQINMDCRFYIRKELYARTVVSLLQSTPLFGVTVVCAMNAGRFGRAHSVANRIVLPLRANLQWWQRSSKVSFICAATVLVPTTGSLVDVPLFISRAVFAECPARQPNTTPQVV